MPLRVIMPGERDETEGYMASAAYEGARVADLLRTCVSIGVSRRAIARHLGYKAEQSLRQIEAGRQYLATDKLEWLESFVAFKTKQHAAEEVWLAKNNDWSRGEG